MRLLLAAVVLLAPCWSARAGVRWGDVLRQPDAWYASAEAAAVADSILQYQTESGGWPKNRDMTAPPDADYRAGKAEDEHAATIDNGATSTQLRFLARVISAKGEARWRASFERGLDYLLAAQYPNGGWPQFFPLRKGYYTHITYNDNAMVNALTVLRDAAAGRAPYAFVDEGRRAKAAVAVEKGLECILRTQVRQDGKLTVWGAQHDETTLEPVWARKFEPPSLVSAESVGIVRFLMSVPKPAPAIVAAVEGAVAWLERVQLKGVREERPPRPDVPGKQDRVLVPDPAAPPMWARFYELGTNRPLYGSRDGKIHYTLAEIEPERRGGYAWHNDEPLKLLQKEYPRWRAQHSLP